MKLSFPVEILCIFFHSTKNLIRDSFDRLNHWILWQGYWYLKHFLSAVEQELVCKLWLEGLSANLEVNKQYVPLTEISSRDEKKQNKTRSTLTLYKMTAPKYYECGRRTIQENQITWLPVEKKPSLPCPGTLKFFPRQQNSCIDQSLCLHREDSDFPTPRKLKSDLKKGKDPDSVTTRRKFGRSRLLKHSFKSNWHDPLDHHRPCAGYRLYHLIPPLSTDCAEKSQPRAFFMSAAGAVEPDCIWLGRLVQDLSWDEGTPSSW